MSHIWFDNRVVEADALKDPLAATYARENPVFMAVARVAALCNHARFKKGQVCVLICVCEICKY